ncbi:hypothetical protein [Pseudoalteromonas sp. ZZD1]|uniref:hypothetical protein n=1 Tax=Pseudoalteromonas sp. ZZD1 TaxID=3139395 RepID=UPI003BAB61F4
MTGNGGGSESVFSLTSNETRNIGLFPDMGHEVVSVTGCNGIWDQANNYEVGPLAASCEVNVEFVETTP